MQDIKNVTYFILCIKNLKPVYIHRINAYNTKKKNTCNICVL